MLSILALTTVLSLSARPAPTPGHGSAVMDSSEMTLVVVQNNRPTAVTVYAEDANGDVQLGSVGPFETRSLRVPDLVVRDGADVDFFVQPKRGHEQESGYLELRRGEHIGLVVPNR